MTHPLSELWQHIELPQSYRPKVAGKLLRMVGLTLEAIGINVRIGERCLVERPESTAVEAEVVGFDGERIFLMPVEPEFGR
jgi:flagellum-specific ATP synthase